MWYLFEYVTLTGILTLTRMLDTILYTLRSQKHLLSGPLQRAFADPCLRALRLPSLTGLIEKVFNYGEN